MAYNVDDLKGAIRTLESKIMNITISIQKNEFQVSEMMSLQDVLRDNISELKKIGIVAKAHDFRKAKEDLQKAELRLRYLQMDRTTLERAHAQQTALLERIQSDLIKTELAIKNNVIAVDFGRKDGNR